VQPTSSTEKTVVIPAAHQLSLTQTYALCYSEGETTEEYLWRDSYIRVTLSQISSFNMQLSAMPAAESVIPINIRTHGQIPAQAANSQITYTYDGLLGGNRIISLVDATLNEVTLSTGVVTAQPCQDAKVVYTAVNDTCSEEDTLSSTDCDHTGWISATASEITGLDSNKLDSDRVYALCYSTASVGPPNLNTFSDSGIRLTTPAITSLSFMDLNFGNPTKLKSQTREIDSVMTATNVLPSPDPSLQVTYVGKLADYNWISLVDHTSNSNNPCADPADAAAANTDSGHSGPFRATSGTSDVIISAASWAYPLGVGAEAPSRLALCYATDDGTGNPEAATWRDSYIRVTMSQITHIVAYQVTHRVQGMIPHHSSLKLDYYGHLGNNQYISLVDSALSPKTIGQQTQSFPCANASQVIHSTDSSHSGMKQAGTSLFPTSKL
jgi:hypothetical protein